MPAPRIVIVLPLICTVLLAAACATNDETTGTPASVILDARWEASLAAFAQSDRLQAPPPGGVLFVGSSSIRLWDGLERQFDTLPIVIKRGFGGSRMVDCAAYADRLVLPYKPRLVLVYAGENDLAEGLSPLQVRDSFRDFVDKVRQALPGTRIAYISVKPSPARRQLLEAVRETNVLVAEYVSRTRNTEYIDIFTPMLDERGMPRAELFRADALHMNAEGYALWKAVISTHIGEYAQGMQ